MTTVREVLAFLEELAPPALAYDYDNVGLLAGFPERRVCRVLCALDITDEVVEEAIGLRAELIVSHHPLIFHPLKSVRADDPVGRKLIRLLGAATSAICMHTNLDRAAGGVNDALAEALGLRVLGPLCPDGIGRVGELPEPMSVEAFLARVKGRLLCAGLRYTDGGREISRVACCGGAGGGEMATALEAGCQAYVTADVKYDQFLTARETALTLVDADHFCTENVVVPKLKSALENRFPDLDIRVSEAHRQAARFY